MTEQKFTHYPDINQSWGIVGIAILMTIISSPIIFLKDYIGEDFSMLLFYVMSMGLTFYIVHKKRLRISNTGGYPFESMDIMTIVLIILATIALQIGLSSPITDLIPMPDSMKEMFEDQLGGKSIFTFLMVVVAAPILEELIFRGIILDGLLRRYTPLKAILMSAFLFGVVHLNPWQFITAMILGTFAGWLYYKTKNLTLPILMHATNNFFAFMSIYYYDQKGLEYDQSMNELMGGLSNYLLLIVGGIVLSALTIYMLHNNFLKSKPIAWQVDEIKETETDLT